MLSWLFKKRGAPLAPTPPAAPAPAGPAAAARSAAVKSVARPAPAVDDGVDWPGRLRAAQGDEAALLGIAQTAPGLAIKIAAVEALASEAALKQAERAFRSHDRKVHSLAKQRLEAAVVRREARAKAQALIERTQALLGDAEVPLNHVVALDREWAALPAPQLEPGQISRQAELRAQLDASLREHGQAQQRLRRWMADAGRSLPELQRRLAEIAREGRAAEVGPLLAAARALQQARPEVPASAELGLALARRLEAAVALEPALAWLEAAQGEDAAAAATASEAATPSEAAEAAEAPAADEAPTPTPTPDWAGLLAPLPGELADALGQRRERWLRAQRPPPAPAAPAAAVEPPRPPRRAPPDAEQRQRLAALMQQAEGALADGHLGAMQQHLQAMDAVLDAAKAALPEALRARHQALRAEGARLKGWQRWGGRRVRDDLVAEAEALARSTQPAPGPPAPEAPPAPGAHVAPPAPDAHVAPPAPGAHEAPAADEAAQAGQPPRPPQAPKLNLQALGENIQALRQRWKELDRLGAEAGPSLWQRFDAALHQAYQPLAAKRAALEESRRENLAAREVLLTELAAVPVPDAAAADDAAAAAWKQALGELGRFQLAWRKLGPIEHTVPADAREALQQRLRAAVDRVEQPLQEARRAAAAVREDLIARADAVAGADLPVFEATRQVRELQAHWQEQARQLPLARGVENALWTRFKSATDAVFAQRQAEFAARDAELAARLADREALLARLAALDGATPLADIEHALAEVDRAWRVPVELPRAAGDAIEERYRTARAAASQLLGAGARQRWQAGCDALAAALARCEAREPGQAADGDPGLQAGAPDGLPAAWREALAQRLAQPAVAGPLPAHTVDELLLQLETALDLPMSFERQAERRKLKLRALKEAFEARRPSDAGAAAPSQWLLALLRQGGLAAPQRERLHALVAALRQSQPDWLGADGSRGAAPLR